MKQSIIIFIKKITNVFLLISIFFAAFEIKSLLASSDNCLKQKLTENNSYKQLSDYKLSNRFIGNFGEEVSEIFLKLKYCELIPINLKYKNPLFNNQGLRGSDHVLWDKNTMTLLIFETKTTKTNKKYLFLENDYQLSDAAIVHNLKKITNASYHEQKILNQIRNLIKLAKLKVKRARIAWDLKEFKGYVIEYKTISFDKAIATNNIENIKNPKYFFQLAFNKCFVIRSYKCDYIR